MKAEKHTRPFVKVIDYKLQHCQHTDYLLTKINMPSPPEQEVK
jgi:hypothetical protein